jgi:hypothetical protein
MIRILAKDTVVVNRRILPYGKGLGVRLASFNRNSALALFELREYFHPSGPAPRDNFTGR